MIKKPERIHQWLLLTFFVVGSIGAGGKIVYDIEMNKTRSEENQKTNRILDTKTTVLETKLDYLEEQNKRALEKLDELLKRP